VLNLLIEQSLQGRLTPQRVIAVNLPVYLCFVSYTCIYIFVIEAPEIFVGTYVYCDIQTSVSTFSFFQNGKLGPRSSRCCLFVHDYQIFLAIRICVNVGFFF
jgi:hypothetical protein